MSVSDDIDATLLKIAAQNNSIALRGMAQRGQRLLMSVDPAEVTLLVAVQGEYNEVERLSSHLTARRHRTDRILAARAAAREAEDSLRRVPCQILQFIARETGHA